MGKLNYTTAKINEFFASFINKIIDTSSLTADNDHIPTSGVVKSVLDNIVLFAKQSSATAVSNTITPSTNQGWFLVVCYNMRSGNAAPMALINWYGGEAYVSNIVNASGFSASVSDGVITLVKGNTYMPMTVISNIDFTLT